MVTLSLVVPVLPTSDGAWFVDVPTAAEQFGISPMMLYRPIAEGKYPAVCLRSRRIIPASPASPRRELRRFMSVAEAAFQLRVSRATLRRMIESGEFPTVAFGSRRMVAAEVLMWLAATAIESSTPIEPTAWTARFSAGVLNPVKPAV